jgi:hypothetical protein
VEMVVVDLVVLKIDTYSDQIVLIVVAEDFVVDVKVDVSVVVDYEVEGEDDLVDPCHKIVFFLLVAVVVAFEERMKAVSLHKATEIIEDQVYNHWIDYWDLT